MSRDIFEQGIPLWDWVAMGEDEPAPNPAEMQHRRNAWIDGRIAEAQRYTKPAPPYKPPGRLQPIDHIEGCRCPVCIAWEEHKGSGRRSAAFFNIPG
jgi:hypothetical protein